MNKIEQALVAGVEASEVTLAGVAFVKTSLLAGDANPAFQILGNGTHQWGAGGASALDTNLYRSTAALLQTDGGLVVRDQLHFTQQAATANIIYAARPADGTPYRFTIDNNGQIQWGPGTGLARDTAVFRNGAGRLDWGIAGTAIRFHFPTGVNPSDIVFSTQLSASLGDTQNRFRIQHDGTMLWGAGTAAPDVTLSRPTTGQLRVTPGPFVVDMGSQNVILGSAHALRQYTTAGDTNEAFRIATGGALSWGAGAASALDTNLYRSAANVLKTDDMLHIVGGASIGTNNRADAGNLFIDNSSVPGTPATGGKLYVVAGALKYIGSSGTITNIANA